MTKLATVTVLKEDIRQVKQNEKNLEGTLSNDDKGNHI